MPFAAQFVGTFLRGVPNGKGHLRFANGDDYTGTFRDGAMDGDGRYRFRATGDVYEGGWQAGRPHGCGAYVWARGRSRYCGSVESGAVGVGGRGCHTNRAHEVYTGEFAGGAYHGWGALVSSTRGHYRGQWRAGQMEGACVWAMPGGSEFRGTVQQGRFEGRGTFLRGEDQSRFTGEFKLGSPWRGRLCSADGTRTEGQFADWLAEGRATVTLRDGQVFACSSWKGGKKNGPGSWTHPARRESFTGGFENDMMQGE